MNPQKKSVGIKGKVLHSQSREIIANVIQFMKQESENGEVSIPLKKLKDRVLAATGISESSYKRINKEMKNIESGQSTSFSTPHKERPRQPSKRALPQGEFETIRSIIHNFYILEKRTPTLKGIYNKVMASELSFTGGLSTLRTIIRQLGFRWVKAADKRLIIKETHDIRIKRIQYLKQFIKYKEEGRPIIYTDETYIHATHTQGKEWSDSSSKGLKRPISKGKRLIIVHAGGVVGFIPNALLIFPSGKKTGDYHDEMNSENFSKWIKTQLLPNLPPNSVLVLDNASYHNVTCEKHPTTNTSKREMIKWLSERNISYDQTMTKPELYGIIKCNKPTYNRYVLDTLLAEKGHVVLRLPPYHPEFNPIEKIWAIVKNWVAARNTTFKLDDVKTLTMQKFESVTVAEWCAICEYTDKVVNEFLNKEHLLDDAFDNLCFTVNTGESDSSLSGIEQLLHSDEEDESD